MGRLDMTPSIHSGPGACREPVSVRTTLRPWLRATFSTPRMSSRAQALSSSWNTSSTRPALAVETLRRR